MLVKQSSILYFRPSIHFSYKIRLYWRLYWILWANHESEVDGSIIFGFLDPKNIEFDMLYVKIERFNQPLCKNHSAEGQPSWIWPYSHQGASASRRSRFLETSYLYLSPCKMPENVYVVQNCQGSQSRYKKKEKCQNYFFM